MVMAERRRAMASTHDIHQPDISNLKNSIDEARGGVAPPDQEPLAPLVKFGNPAFVRYAWPADATESFHMRVAVVNLPRANSRKGLLAWPALGHETCGHDILHADNGLLSEV